MFVFKIFLVIPLRIQHGLKTLIFQPLYTNYDNNSKISKREIFLQHPVFGYIVTVALAIAPVVTLSGFQYGRLKKRFDLWNAAY